MPLDIELYRRTIYIPARNGLRRISVIDIQPEEALLTLVFAHGYGGGATQWLHQLRFFGQTARVIAPDLRGHGGSDDPPGVPYTMSGLVDDLEAVLERLEVRRPFYLIAHSFGGAVATEYVLRHPEQVRGLVLIGVPTRFMVRAVLRRLMLIPDPLFSWIARKIQVALYAPQPTLRRMLATILSTWRGEERMEQLRVPTLVIRGHRDIVFQREYYEDTVRRIPGAQQAVIPVSAHLVQLERPDAVNRAIRRFIESQHAPDLPARPFQVTASMHTARHAEMPWLQHYDSDVPETLPVPQTLLHDLLQSAAHDFPERPALIYFGQKIGYRELDALSNRFARALRAMGIQKGDRVGIVLPNIPQLVIAFYGTLKAGGVAVLGSPLSNEQEVAYQLQHSEAKALVTLVEHRSMVERIYEETAVERVIYTDVREYLPLRQRVQLAHMFDDMLIQQKAGEVMPQKTRPLLRREVKRDTLQALLRSQSAQPLDSGTASCDLALLQYTSGTTDVPKGVMLSHQNLVMNVAQQRHWIADARRGHETVLGVLPLSHSYGISSCMNLSIALAGSLVLVPTQRTEQALREIKHHHPTIFPGVPALYLSIANYPRVRSYGVAAIRVCVSGSDPLPVEVQEAFEKLTRGRLVEGYGLTEASPSTHCNPIKGERVAGSIGVPLPETSARVVDWRSGEPLPAGEVGELLIRGPQVMQGYWKMPEETHNTLANGWLRTGDLARMDEDGFFYIVDRKQDLILAGPYNVYPRDVEEVLYEHPKVLEVAVVSKPEAVKESTGKATTTTSPFIKAVVVLKRGEKATAEELLALCRERLDAYKVPQQVEFRTELPKNFVGKVLRRLLVEA
jgi:long-chain acyl-CoA synthetase